MGYWAVATLEGRRVRLEPLRLEHVGELLASACEDVSTFGYTLVPQDEREMHRHVTALLADDAAGTVVAFAQVDASTGRAVGMTRFLTIRARPGAATPYAVEIGGTWLAASAQRTGINTEAKRLLMAHAFEAWAVARVDLKTDDRNVRAKAAIERLGARFEGVLRHWQPSMVPGEEDRYRVTAMYSVTDEEWPVVAQRLGELLR